MVFPTITAVSRDVLRAIPVDQREAALALGATRWEMIKMTVFPFARAGIVSSIMLGLGRALGETMAVTFVIGNAHKVSASILQPGTTISATIGAVSVLRSVGLLRGRVATPSSACGVCGRDQIDEIVAIAPRIERVVQIELEVLVGAAHDIEIARGIDADFVVGCDGYHGVARRSVPAGAVRTFERARVAEQILDAADFLENDNVGVDKASVAAMAEPRCFTMATTAITSASRWRGRAMA